MVESMIYISYRSIFLAADKRR